MNEAWVWGAAVWGLAGVPDLARPDRLRRPGAWAAAASLLAAAGAVVGAPFSWRSAGVGAAWAVSVAGPWAFRAARRRSERAFRARLRELRAPVREAAGVLNRQQEALHGVQGRLERIQNRFALLQTMATRLDVGGILRSLGELWSSVPQVKRCVLMQRLPNGNWSSVFAHGAERPEEWAAFANENTDWTRSRKARRFSGANAALVGLGVKGPFFLAPFIWGEDVMALGALELESSVSEDALEDFQVERKLVSIGLRRAFLYDLMSERSRHDGLTGALLRRPFLERLEEALRNKQRYKTPLALALFDADHFKQVNDRFGHLAGDRALVHLARTVHRMSVPGVTLGRWGGDEFALILELPAFEESWDWVEKYREEIRGAPLREGENVFSVTVSVGLAEAPSEKISAEELLQRADKALYSAKGAGRDRVEAVLSPTAGVR